MARVVKVNLDSEGGVPLDAVEGLLTKVTAGEDLVVFGDDGSIIFVNTDIGDSPHEFEEV